MSLTILAGIGCAVGVVILAGLIALALCCYVLAENDIARGDLD